MPFLRLLLLTADYPPSNWSGIGTAVSHQAAALAELGVDVHVLTPAMVDEDQRVHHLTRDRFPIAIETDDVVVLHSLALAELAFELRRRYRLPLLYTAHSVVEIELREGAAKWIDVQRRLFDEADRVMFVSRAEYEAAARLIPGLATRASVLHDGVPAPPAPRVYDAHGPVVFAGRFTRIKGFDVVLEMVSTMSAPFVLAGGHGDRDLREHARSLDANGRCEVKGWIDRAALDELFATASLVIMPSRYEPFGMVALESMRMGAPLLASACGGLAEIVTSASGGRWIPEPDARSWISACTALLADHSERQAMHERGPSYVARHFDARVVATELLSVIESL
jgi:glycogen synthase